MNNETSWNEPATEADAKRKQLNEQIQMVLSGHENGIVLQALMDSVSFVLAFNAKSVRDADQMFDLFRVRVRKMVRANWEFSRAMRSVNSQGGLS